ncbi:hypothetical protein [Clavibacter nebraskensis]|uniref:Integral membrane protein n=2 Tax=Clavibacter nebraskensis TaxID=31963 RepID=A0ABY4MTH2_9MICO|nr:hypothetical protein [Clavibacter nebraskensis]KXU21143.1 hypothetical protein VV38_04915 [Clavibacter nebraskensis]OAH21824.1 hypothetical protein A3Q38_00515 [Clavibacter nebraskensis]QGV66284.1 hypothetical protein EGX36_05255 [Clavibacter nebraskensis]QGV69083.1 hypothetical protein EGX37_05245 [Clavibacter nebraskensis]QGV71873.1 hypothetical protein EGX35_05245 [Clavibacter nebraskensis]
MPRTPDDDALSWAGEDADPTLARSPEPQRAVPRRRPDDAPATGTGRASALGATAARRAAASGSAAGSDEPRDGLVDDDDPAPDASPEVVGLAFFGAVAVLETIAWFFVVRDNPSSAGSWFQVGVAQATEALTVLAPLLWLAAVVAALRGMRVGRRMLVLAAGAVVLFPWPWVVTR